MTPQGELAQSVVLTPGSISSITKAERVFSGLRVEFTCGGLYACTEGQQDVPAFSWPQNATEDSVAEAACQHLQSTYMPEDVMIIAIQSVVWMGHDWPEANLKIKETSCTDYVMGYWGVALEMADLLIDKRRICAALNAHRYRIRILHGRYLTLLWYTQQRLQVWKQLCCRLSTMWFLPWWDWL